VAIRASATVTVKASHFPVEKSVKPLFNRSTLRAGALAVEPGRNNRRLGDEQRSGRELPD
jgi:hypothetical protein